MSYSTAQAALLADQLERLATQAAHQIAGQVANLGFWLSEAEHVIRVIDEYPLRFQRQRDAQAAWVEAHGTRVSGYCVHCGGACEFGPRKPDPVRRVSHQELAAARASVCRGA